MTKPKPKTAPAPSASEIGAFPDVAPSAASSAPAPGMVSIPPEVQAQASETIAPKASTTAAPADPKPAETPATPVGYMLQPRLAGYRYLTERDAALINRVKSVARDARELAEDLERNGATGEDLQTGVQYLKIGFSLLTRSVAKPTEW